MKKIVTILLLGLVFFTPHLFFKKSEESNPHFVYAAEDSLTLDGYIEEFYNRYSSHFDIFGLTYSAPGYGIENFKGPETAREFMSLAAYYKYRAMAGDAKALRVIRFAIIRADQELSSRPDFTQSFEDAAAQFLMIRLIGQVDGLLSADEKDELLQKIAARAAAGIAAQDTSNRAALSAFYWQVIIDHLVQEKYLNTVDHLWLSHRVKEKMVAVLVADIDGDAWYREGTPFRFNPHYHVVTATALLGYGELTNQWIFSNLALRMTQNLRKVTFHNGMVEAQLGDRPIGLGAQFYLGAGVLNKFFEYPEYGAYLIYARGQKFFSDRAHPNRLEYHSTIVDSAPEFHDDWAFSNMAELLLSFEPFGREHLDQAPIIVNFPGKFSGENISGRNDDGKTIWLGNLRATLDSSGNWSHVIRLR